MGVGIGLHTCPGQTQSACHQVQGCRGLSAGIGLRMFLRSAPLWHCAAAYLGSGKVPTEISGPHRCPTQVGGASQIQQGHCATACFGKKRGQASAVSTGPPRCPTQAQSACQVTLLRRGCTPGERENPIINFISHKEDC